METNKTQADKPFISIWVTPRERYALTETCLEHIYAFTEGTFEVIVVDGGSAPAFKKGIEKWGKSKTNCKVIRTEHFLMPNEAKNLAMKAMDPSAEWIVLIDNDVKVHPNWLDSMLAAGEESGACAVHPLYLIEQQSGISLHMADGVYKNFKKNGSVLIQPVMNLVGQNIVCAAGLKRQASDFVEFHCCMLRRDLLDDLGEFEPVHLGEDMHYSLRIREKGGKITFEPRSVITYVAGPPFDKRDIPYFKFRRSIKVGEETIAALRKRWPGMQPGYWEGKLAWLHYHRSRVSMLFPAIKQLRAMQPYSRTARWIGKKIPAISGR